MTSRPCVVSFVVPGTPRAKMRPWATAARGRTHVFTPRPTQDYEAVVRASAAAVRGGSPPLDGPIAAHIRIRLAPPVRVARTVRADMMAGRIRPTRRPDVDNVVKAILDGSNGVAITDDACVVSLSAEKVYAEDAGVDVRFESLAGGLDGDA